MENNSTVYISLLAVIFSAFSLGWNVYRDVILKPRLKVSICISYILHGDDEKGPYIDVSATNLGPGVITCESVDIAKKSKFRFLGNKFLGKLNMASQYASVVHDYTNPYSAQLPKKLEVGERINLLFPETENAFLSINPTHVGICDSFGRTHWASSSSLKEAKNEYFKKFSKKNWGDV